MCPTFEFTCENELCECFGTHDEPKVKEVFCRWNDKPKCEFCEQELKKIMSAPRGYVKYSPFPVKQ